MNNKLHTPKSLKAGSGIATLKQFLLSLIATSVSIALTFGTAAVIDGKKKQKEKREMVMMVMYDMYNTLKEVAEADSMIRYSMDLQRQLAEDTTRFDELKYTITASLPIMVEYTGTTERIFSSNIETIHTVSNVLFTENVACFYQIRQNYKTNVCDSLLDEGQKIVYNTSAKEVLDLSLLNYAIMTGGILADMQHLYNQCKQMMDISDKEVEAYLLKRKQMEGDKSENEKKRIKIIDEVKQLQDRIDKAKGRLR